MEDIKRRSFLKGFGAAAATAALAGGRGFAGGFGSGPSGIPARPLTQRREGVFTPPTKESPLYLNYNENNLGMSPKARQALIDDLGRANRYPDDEVEALLGTLAERFQFKPEQFSLGVGSSQSITATIMAQYKKAERENQKLQIVAADPTYGIAQDVADNLGLKYVGVPLNGKKEADLTALKRACDSYSGPSLVYLCNPNNPTATIVSSAELERWVKGNPETFFIIDEAYWDFVQSPRFFSGMRWIHQGLKNVVVAHTFSKVYALAGMRVGYVIGVPEVITEVEKYQSWDNMSLSVVPARASLLDTQFRAYSIAMIAESRRIVMKALDELGLEYAESHANFILHEVPGTVKTYRDTMMSKYHIKVGRDFPPYTTWGRLSLGTPDEMKYFVECFKKVVAQTKNA